MDAETLKYMGTRVDKARILITHLGDLRRAREDITDNSSLRVTFNVPGTTGGSHSICQPSCEQLEGLISNFLDEQIANAEIELEAL